MNAYDTGDLLRLACVFVTLGTVTDPTTVALRVRDPGGAVTSYTYAAGSVIRSAVGSYYYDLSLATVGQYRYRWTGTGAGQGAMEGAFFVRDQEA